MVCYMIISWHYCPFVRGIHSSQDDSLNKGWKGQRCGDFVFFDVKAAKQTIESPVIWYTMALMRHHCKVVVCIFREMKCIHVYFSSEILLEISTRIRKIQENCWYSSRVWWKIYTNKWCYIWYIFLWFISYQNLFHVITSNPIMI